MNKHLSNRLMDVLLSLPSERLLNVFRKLVAWQLAPFAFSSISIRKPISHNRQLSYRHDVEAWVNAILRSHGVNLYSWRRGFAYEFAICVSNPEKIVLLKYLRES